MTALPAAGELALATNPDEDDAAVSLTNLLEFVRQGVGGAALAALTIASGVVTPVSALVTVDTEASAATDDLDTISQTNLPAGSLIIVRLADAARVVTLKNGGGAGGLSHRDSKDVVLRSVRHFVVYVGVGVLWCEVCRNVGNELRTVRALTSATTLVASDSGTTITNTGAVGDLDHPLPAATVGMSLRVRVTAAFKIKLTANGTDTITDDNGTTVSAAGGNTEIAAVVGNAFDIECYEAGKWVVTYARGTLTTT